MKNEIHKISQISFDKQIPKAERIQTGFSLIEIMVAAVILSIGVLGVVSLQIIGLKGTHQSYMKQQAMAIVQSLTERMHSNKQGVIAGNYVASNASVDCADLPVCNTATSSCSVADIAKVDLHNVMCGYKAGAAPSTGGIKANAAGDIVALVNGRLDISCPAGDCTDGDVQINIRWTERAIGQETVDVDADGASNSLSVTTRIIR